LTSRFHRLLSYQKHDDCI